MNSFLRNTTLGRWLLNVKKTAKSSKCLALKAKLKYTAALLCFSGLLTCFPLSLLLDKFSFSVTYFDLKGSLPRMHLTLHVSTVAEAFCRKLDIDSVVISMNML